MADPPVDIGSIKGPDRRLDPQWDAGLIAASIAISFLGSFTSTQLMCHARLALSFTSVCIWTGLASLVFGFCSIWCLHEVAMLACQFDLQIGIDAPLTVLSALLAVVFTWIALASDLMWDRWRRHCRRKKRNLRISRTKISTRYALDNVDVHQPGTTPLLSSHAAQGDDDGDHDYLQGDHSQSIRIKEGSLALAEQGQSRSSSPLSPGPLLLKPPSNGFGYDAAAPGQGSFSNGISSASKAWLASGAGASPETIQDSPQPLSRAASELDLTDTMTRTSSDYSSTRRGSNATGSSSGYLGLSSAMGMVYRRGTTTGNAFVRTGKALYAGCTIRNIAKGLFWSIAITSMHYVGIRGLRIPNGFFHLSPTLVLASGLISWAVCVVGVILMADMETHLLQQLLFSAVATTGVAAMHFTGMQAATFWSNKPPSEIRGYPPALANSVIAVAGMTCIAANLLLAHSATMSRNKLAEVVWTRKELWKAIAQKENAEAAALARSEFIASASHEIRTPLHHLQGYSDLLSQTALTEEGRSLLRSIQAATKTLSMITTNVLDWSKLERNAEAAYRPTAIDIRAVCESIIILLPNVDEEMDVELFLVVAPDVPMTLFMDETYVHRILMNLLSNALKFTKAGYILLSIETSNDRLIAKVEDTGCGLAPDFIPKMWEPFQQGEVRGSQRGTGLGLSIIKQLLQRMDGSIEVESRFKTEDSGPFFRSGSTFTITLPLNSTSTFSQIPRSTSRENVALLVDDESRYSEGLRRSWEKFGYQVITAQNISDLPPLEWKYVWADPTILRGNQDLFRTLLQRDEWNILVPFGARDSLDSLPGIQAAIHIVTLQRPLIWHLFERRVLSANQPSPDITLPKTLRFAPEVEVMDDTLIERQRTKLNSEKAVVMLVEDNPINQKLGKKMLTALGYEVLTADDGQHCLEQIVEHDSTVDIILMDESMPRKCGTQATKEIRDMEASGRLSRRRPIIAVTAVVSTKAQAQFKQAGADDFLAKPLSLAKLRDTLSVYLPSV